MLLNNFFSIRSVQRDDTVNLKNNPVTRYRVDIHLDVSHSIFQGHFPGNPVVPGVCQIHMITETLSEILGNRLFLTWADNVKFLSMINPVENPDIYLELILLQNIEENVTASLGFQDKIFLKFKGIFKTSLNVAESNAN